jgi:hypothetical protein
MNNAADNTTEDSCTQNRKRPAELWLMPDAKKKKQQTLTQFFSKGQ